MVARETLVRDGLSVLGFGQEVVDKAVDGLVQYAELLESEAIPRGYVGVGDAGRVVARHVLECAALGRFAPVDNLLIDVGSGAGLPGVVLAHLREGPVVIVESHRGRAMFVRRAVRALELDGRVKVLSVRAEDAARTALRESAAVAVGRALATLPVALELVVPFVGCGGVAILSSPGPLQCRRGGSGEASRAEEHGDAVWPMGAMSTLGVGPDESHGGDFNRRFTPEALAVSELLGGSPPRAVRFEVPGSIEARWVMIVDKLRPTPDCYPRRAGVPARKPLGS
jgi:16S rRNA (guanine527-N7)-methyltransferase